MMKPTLKNDKLAGIVRENDAVLPIETLTGTSIPTAGKQYNYTPTEGASLTFFTPEAGYDNAFKLNIVMGASAVSFTFPATVTWRAGAPTFAAGTNTLLRFAWDGSNWVGEYEAQMDEFYKKTGGEIDGYILFNIRPQFTNTITANGIAISHGGCKLLSRGIVCGYNSEVGLSSEDSICVGTMAKTYYGKQCIVIGNYSEIKNSYGSIAVGSDIKMSSKSQCAGFGKNIKIDSNSSDEQLVTGRFNTPVQGARITGNGTADNARRNIEVLDWNGNLTLAGDVIATVDGGTVSLADLARRVAALEQA